MVFGRTASCPPYRGGVPAERLNDAYGPDGIRVTLAVEPHVRRMLPALVQRRRRKQRWAILVQAESGQRVRLVRDSREQAVAVAEGIRRNVEQEGVRVLDELR